MRNTLLFQYTLMSETAWDVNDHTMHYGWEQSAFLKKHWKQMILFMPFSLIIILEYLFPLYNVLDIIVHEIFKQNTHQYVPFLGIKLMTLALQSYGSTNLLFSAALVPEVFLPFIFPIRTFVRVFFKP